MAAPLADLRVGEKVERRVAPSAARLGLWAAKTADKRAAHSVARLVVWKAAHLVGVKVEQMAAHWAASRVAYWAVQRVRS